MYRGGGNFATGIFRCGKFRISNVCEISRSIFRPLCEINPARNLATMLDLESFEMRKGLVAAQNKKRTYFGFGVTMQSPGDGFFYQRWSARYSGLYSEQSWKVRNFPLNFQATVRNKPGAKFSRAKNSRCKNSPPPCRRGGTSEVAPEAVRQAVGGGCQSGWGRLLSVTNAIEAGAWRQGDSGWA